MTEDIDVFGPDEEGYIEKATEKAGITHQELYQQIYRDPKMHAAFMAGKWARPYKGLDGAIEYILENLDLKGEDFEETPRRVATFLRSFRHGSPESLAALLKTFTETSENVLVVQGNIPFSGLCAHHLVPFAGTAIVGYIPRKRKVGLSKLARVVQAAGRLQPSTQEDITNLVADTLFRELEPLAAGVVTRAWHGCMSVRGVMAPNTWTVVSALRGQFLLNPSARQEFMSFWERAND